MWVPLAVAALVAVFGANGILLFMMQQRMVPKVEQIKLGQTEQANKVTEIDLVAQRQNTEIEYLSGALREARDEKDKWQERYEAEHALRLECQRERAKERKGR